jgi:DNA-directed RNA polymerase
MTYVYGLRPYGARQQIYDEYKKRVELGQKPKCLKDDGFADCKWLSEIVWRHIENEIFLASELMKWFQDTAKLFGQANVAMKWTTPMGFPVVMDYRYLAKFRVKTAIAGSLVYTTLRRQMDKKDTRKFVSSSAPNIVHSLDGAVAQATALQCKLIGNPIPNLMMIHDSFATTPNRIDDLHQVIRDVVVRLFDEDYMEKLYNEFLVNLPDKFKDKLTRPPKKGDMQLQDVKNSLYFFS